MLSEILSFAGLLRKAGINLTSSEILDLCRAIKVTGADREGLLIAMGATLVKQESQVHVLQRLFELFWDKRAGGPGENKPNSPPCTAPRMKKAQFQEKLDHLKSYIRREKMRLAEEDLPGSFSACAAKGSPGSGKNRLTENPAARDEFVSTILDGKEQGLRHLLDRASESISGEFDHGELTRRLRIASGWAEDGELLEKICLSGSGLDRWRVMESLDRFSEMLSFEADRRIWSSRPDLLLSRLNYEDISFNRLDYDQSREIKKKLFRLGKRLAVRSGYRYAPSRRGVVDLRRTAALAGALGGVPASILLRKRKPLRPELVILCDLSGSVSNFSRFMMLLVSAMHDRFRSARSFAFVDAVEEVTAMIRGCDAEKKISGIIRNTGIWRTGFSDYGEVWRQFEKEHLEALGPKTTLVILGDARNNYKPDGVDHFIKIAGRPKRVIWLNPAPKDSWDREDGIMSRYAPYCHNVFQCSNIRQLEYIAGNVFN